MDELRLRDEGLVWREIDGELVVLDVEQSVYLASNETGTLLWRALAEGTTHEQLVQLLVTHVDVPVDIATGDVDAFLVQLRERGVLDT